MIKCIRRFALFGVFLLLVCGVFFLGGFFVCLGFYFFWGEGGFCGFFWDTEKGKQERFLTVILFHLLHL